MIILVFGLNISLVIYQLLYMIYYKIKYKNAQQKWEQFYKIEPKLINFIVYYDFEGDVKKRDHVRDTFYPYEMCNRVEEIIKE